MHKKCACIFMHTQSHKGILCTNSVTQDCRVRHTCAHTVSHIHLHMAARTPGCTYTYTWLKSLLFTSCLHHAQVGCERMHFWQEGAGWQDPGRDRSGSPQSVASPGDEILVSNSLSLLLRTSRKTRTIDKATMVCNRI